MRVPPIVAALILVAGTWSEPEGALPALPDAELTTPSGEPASRASWQGKVVLLDFWATWCGPCRQALPAYAALHEELGPKGLVVVGVSVDEHDADVTRFLKRNAVPFEVLRDPRGEWAAAMELPGMPTSFLIDRKGRVRDRHLGYTADDLPDLRARIEALLDETEP